MITPLNNRIIVKEIRDENKTDSGIILTDEVNPTAFFKAEILRISAKLDLKLEPGMIIHALIGSGQAIGNEDGELILEEKHIVAIEADRSVGDVDDMSKITNMCDLSGE